MITFSNHASPRQPKCADGRQVLAYRGTDDLWDGLMDDLGIAVGTLPPQAVARSDRLCSRR